MPKLTFRGAYLRYVDVRQEEGGIVARLHVSADYSAPICKEMEWPPTLDPTMTSAKLEGERVLNNFVLTPNGGEEMRKFEVDITARDMTGFSVKRVTDGDSNRTELQFQIRCGDAKGILQLINYISKVGENPGALKVDCVKQTELDLEEVPEEQAEMAEA